MLRFTNLLRIAHLVVGIVGLILFLLSGQYMDLVHDHLRGMPDGPRLLFRSTHIFLLWSSLLNLLLGCYLTSTAPAFLRYVRVIGSYALLVGPPLLAASFLVESQTETLVRPIARVAIYLALAGAIAHAIAALWPRRTTNNA